MGRSLFEMKEGERSVVMVKSYCCHYADEYNRKICHLYVHSSVDHYGEESVNLLSDMTYKSGDVLVIESVASLGKEDHPLFLWKEAEDE